jgi:hypothetical protein
MLVHLWGYSPTSDPELASELARIGHDVAVLHAPDLEPECLDSSVAFGVLCSVERTVVPLSVHLENNRHTPPEEVNGADPPLFVTEQDLLLGSLDPECVHELDDETFAI